LSNRIQYIDIARGIGILLVVLGHNDFALVSPFIYQVIYSFHMPLFFFLSGFFINPSTGFWEFVRRRFNSLLKPYLFTIFMIYFVSISFEKMSFQTALFRITKSVYGSGYYLDWVQLWFLPHLFVVSLYAYIFLNSFNRLNNRWLRWGILLATLAISIPFLKTFYPFPFQVLGRDYELYGLPFSLDLVLLSGFFFILGSEIRQITSEETFSSPILLAGTGIALLLLNFFFAAKIDFNTRLYESFLINTAESILGILFILALSRQIELRSERLASIFRYFGQVSLIILIFHVPIQDFWAQKVLAVTNNTQLSIWTGFFMGVAGSILIYELFIKANPVASFWFGREAPPPEKKESTLPSTG
jgi:polysaccharide biosynthesis protein PslL